MNERLEALAKALWDAQYAHPPWEDCPADHGDFHELARAALTFLGFDPENPPEEGAGRDAIVLLRRYCTICDSRVSRLITGALRALGVTEGDDV